MRKIFFDKLVIIPLLLALLATASCSKTGLNATVTSNLDSTTVFTDSAAAMSFLNYIYTKVGFATDPKRFVVNGVGAGLDAACDEAEGPNASSSNGFTMFATGTVNPTVVPTDAWATSYGMIRAANQYLQHLNIIPFNSQLKAETKAEARF